MPPEVQTTPEQLKLKEKTRWDEATLYACAFVCKRQEEAHLRKSGELALSKEQKCAHIFASRNAHALAISILMMAGVTQEEAQMNAEDMQVIIAQGPQWKNKKP